MDHFITLNPYTGIVENRFAAHQESQVEGILARAAKAHHQWRISGFGERSALLYRLADALMARRDELALTMTREMGKRLAESLAEVDKCISVCRYYADNAESMLASVALEAGDDEAQVHYQSLGPVLAIMPWNFPLWQVFRFLAPTLMVGNVALLKHAPNAAASALNIAALFEQAGAPQGVFQNLFVDLETVEKVIADGRVRGVTLTGSERAGRAVGALAGGALKPCVLELGGSDPFIVLADADLDAAVEDAVTSRFMNAGQTCIAAKRLIVEAPVMDAFKEALVARVADLRYGDPQLAQTGLAPMARQDLRDQLHGQVTQTLGQGARCLMGGQPIAGSYAGYEATILDGVTPEMLAANEELFGPVACLMSVESADAALALANRSRFGLGASLWTRDRARAEVLASQIESGAVFINGFVKSDPRWPFGGVKHSGFGRELWRDGLTAFSNAQLQWCRGLA